MRFLTFVMIATLVSNGNLSDECEEKSRLFGQRRFGHINFCTNQVDHSKETSNFRKFIIRQLLLNNYSGKAERIYEHLEEELFLYEEEEECDECHSEETEDDVCESDSSESNDDFCEEECHDEDAQKLPPEAAEVVNSCLSVLYYRLIINCFIWIP